MRGTATGRVQRLFAPRRAAPAARPGWPLCRVPAIFLPLTALPEQVGGPAAVSRLRNPSRLPVAAGSSPGLPLSAAPPSCSRARGPAPGPALRSGAARGKFAPQPTLSRAPVTLEVYAAASLSGLMDDLDGLYKQLYPNVTINLYKEGTAPDGSPCV